MLLWLEKVQILAADTHRAREGLRAPGVRVEFQGAPQSLRGEAAGGGAGQGGERGQGRGGGGAHR